MRMKFSKTFLKLVVLTLLSCAACTNQEIAAPPMLSAAPTSVALIKPTATTDAPTIQPTSISAEMIDQPLDKSQRTALEGAAIKYLAPYEEEATRVARELGYIGANANPATMCGPLAIRILQDAGLMDPAVDLLDFFYLDPRPGADYSRLEEIFPKQIYDWIVFDQPINKIDYSKTPLFAGDFIYLFAGDSGSFEHMLVVTRVDDDGRAYSVTNFNIGKEVVIEEVMLYDPAKPGEGQFYKWTDWENRAIGRTGYGGMWVWRLNQPVIEPDAAASQLSKEINDVIVNTGGDWHILFKVVGGEEIYSRLPYASIHPASVIKLADAVVFIKILESLDIKDIPLFLLISGSDGRSFNQLLRAMIVNSEEKATTSLEKWISQSVDINEYIHSLGYQKTYIIPRRSNAAEMSRMIEELYNGSLVEEPGKSILLNLLAEYTDSDNSRIDVIRTQMDAEDRLYNKHGSLVTGQLVVADLAIIEHGATAYTLALFAYPEQAAGDYHPGYDDLESGIEQISNLVWLYIYNR